MNFFISPFIKMQFYLTLTIWILFLLARKISYFSIEGVFISWLLGAFAYAVVMTIAGQCFKIDLLKILEKRKDELEDDFYNKKEA